MPVKRSVEVTADLRAKILDGTYPAGEPLPRSDILQAMYGVGPYAITTAMRELKSEGLVWRVANKGMIVRRPPEPITVSIVIPPLEDHAHWADACRRAGLDGQLDDKTTRFEFADHYIAQALHLDDRATVMQVLRLGTVDDQAACIDRVSYPADLVPGRPSRDAVRNILSRVDPATAYVDLRIFWRQAEGPESTTLKVSGGVGVIDITRVIYDSTGQPVELLHRVANAQRVQLDEQRRRLSPGQPND
ncbi:GntR family transcriptional regulator [Planotetraspora phitsanulokensis]|uniref:GntR family transcriptional regulator n=1 Tax=Planotetraspora phitsanulokensis TaxID=575192 RepID=A0A8J3XJ78_9ACTN|nr:GntR family transcriptional regulator [Planotetraspora phitsanulokensis]GII42905.1 GntR family transcriptional regulator [Planotetraspora phitsanulokensis]